MARQILVALKSKDRLSQIIPYIETNAQPGMEVIFLIRFTPNACFSFSHESWLSLKPVESDYQPEAVDGYSAAEGFKQEAFTEEQQLTAEHNAILALDALTKKGVRIAVDVHTGSLKKAVRRYAEKGNVHLIITRARRVRRTMQYLLRKLAIAEWIKKPTFSPLPLLDAK
jgi:hypothetical protein